MSRSEGKPIHQYLTPDHSEDCNHGDGEANVTSEFKDVKTPSPRLRCGRSSPRLIERAQHRLSRDDLDKQIESWSVRDVEQWVRSKQLFSLLPLITQNHVTGKDLVNLNLSFVYDSDFSSEDREALLGEIYSLVSSPGMRSPREPRHHSRQEQEKYVAAVRVARSRDRSSSPSLVVFSRSPSPGGASVLSLPVMKSRSRSESGMESILSELTPTASPARKYLKRKSTPNVLLAAKGLNRRPSLHQVFSVTGPQRVFCCTVVRQGGAYDFVCDASGNSPTVVKSVTHPSPLKVGDFILEMNGISLMRGDNSSSTELLLERLMSKSDALQLVVARQQDGLQEEETELEELNLKLKGCHKRWQKMRDFLVGMQSENYDPKQVIQDTPPDQIQEMKNSIALQEEVQQLREALTGHVTTVDDLQKTLGEKTVALLEMERQRDAALSKLETITFARSQLADPISVLAPDTEGSPGERCRSVGAGVYAEILERLEQDSASKEDSLSVLRETIQEALTQKSYLDKLMCVVVEEVPWLLDVIDTDLADLDDPPQGQEEEFC